MKFKTLLLISPIAFLIGSCSSNPKPDPKEYELEFKGINCTATNKKTYKEGEQTEFHINANDGFVLPETEQEIEVEGMDADDYEYDYRNPLIGARFIFTMPANKVTVKVEASEDKPETYTITTEVGGVSFSPEYITEDTPYVGTINFDGTDEKILPASLISVVLDDGEETDITDACTYERSSTQTASFTIPDMYAHADVKVNLETKDQDTFSLSSSPTDVDFNPNDMKEAEEYVGTITYNSKENILPESLDSVILDDGEETDIEAECSYSRHEDNKRVADFTIPAKYANADVTVNFTPAEPAKYNITVKDGVEGITFSPDFVMEGTEYQGTISLKSTEKVLPVELDSVVLDNGEETDIKDECTYTKQDAKTAFFEIPAEYACASVEVGITLDDPVSDLTFTFTPTNCGTTEEFKDSYSEGDVISFTITCTDSFVLPQSEGVEVTGVDKFDYNPVGKTPTTATLSLMMGTENVEVKITATPVEP